MGFFGDDFKLSADDFNVGNLNTKVYDRDGNLIETLNGKVYIGSHIEETNDISNLIKINRDKINEIIDKILDICKNKKTYEQILKELFDGYNLNMNLNQYYLVGSTIKSYLSYLIDLQKIKYEFVDNLMYYTILTND